MFGLAVFENNFFCTFIESEIVEMVEVVDEDEIWKNDGVTDIEAT